jgi:uncharacterized protein YcfL
MRKAIAVFLLLVLLLTLGCAAKRQAAASPGAHQKVSVEPPVAPAAGGATASAVSDVDKELSEIDSIDSELSSEELDSLDSELDFEI